MNSETCFVCNKKILYDQKSDESNDLTLKRIRKVILDGKFTVPFYAIPKDKRKMIKIELLRKILNAEESQLKKIDTDRLRTMLGAFLYFVRLLEREINKRCLNQSLGDIGIEKIEGKRNGRRQKVNKL